LTVMLFPAVHCSVPIVLRVSWNPYH